MVQIRITIDRLKKIGFQIIEQDEAEQHIIMQYKNPSFEMNIEFTNEGEKCRVYECWFNASERTASRVELEVEFVNIQRIDDIIRVMDPDHMSFESRRIDQSKKGCDCKFPIYSHLAKEERSEDHPKHNWRCRNCGETHKSM